MTKFCLRTLVWTLTLWLVPASVSAQVRQRIGVDPGHGGDDPGAVGPTGLNEKDVNLTTALALKKYLEADGATVSITRSNDATVSLVQRTNYLIAAGATRIVSVHHNSAGPTASSTMDFVYCGRCAATAASLASPIVQRLSDQLGVAKGPAASTSSVLCPGRTAWFCPTSGIGEANLHMVREPEISTAHIPSVLAEVSFISNPNEEARLKGAAYLDHNGWAIYAGVADYYGVTPVAYPGGTPPPSPVLVTRSVSAPAVGPNQAFTVNATMRVDSALAEHAGISISFPSLTTAGKSGASYDSAQGSVSTNLASSGATQGYYNGGDAIGCRANTSCASQHLLAEAIWDNVSAGSTKTFNLTVTPKQSGSFVVRVRAWATTNGYQSVTTDPTSGVTDQQNYWVYDYTVSVSGPTLSVALEPTPSSGDAPLLSTLRATPSGTATGTLNYSFWWNCSSTASTVNGAASVCGALPLPSQGACASSTTGYKCDGVSDVPKSIAHTYSSPGSYTAKVIVERGSASPAEARATVTAVAGSSAVPAIGSGIGGLGNTHSHLDTWFNPRTWPFSDEYLLRDTTRRAGNNIHGHGGQMGSDQVIETLVYGLLFNSTMSDADNAWNAADQAAGIDAHGYAAKTYDFLLPFGVNSYDNNGSSMFSIVDDSSAINRNNASFDPATKRVYYGRVDAATYRPFSAAIDIVGHEWAHGFTNAPAHSQLNYVGESGALNEAFSDWVGVSLKRSNGKVVWTQGEDASWSGAPMRDLANPRSNPVCYSLLAGTFCGQPDYYKDDKWYPTTGDCSAEGNDACGVHINSGVPNKMFYLLAETGVHVHKGVSVSGLGPDTALRIAINANKSWWSSTTDFAGARSGMIAAAAGFGTNAVEQV